MKKTLLIMAAAALSGLSCLGQTKDCNCAKKTVHHRTVHRKSVVVHHTTVNKQDELPVCLVYSQSKMKECPPGFAPGSGCIYDATGNVKFEIANSFTGNYPSTEVGLMPARKLMVSSTAFSNMGAMPTKYTCEGSSVSPPLKIDNIPPETQSLAVVMYDPNANERGSETYWLIWGLDPAGIVPENFVNDHESMNAAKEYGYHPACPISGTHYYHFMVYALDTKLNGNRQVTKDKLENAMRGHVLAKGELIGVYDRL